MMNNENDNGCGTNSNCVLRVAYLHVRQRHGHLCESVWLCVCEVIVVRVRGEYTQRQDIKQLEFGERKPWYISRLSYTG